MWDFSYKKSNRNSKLIRNKSQRLQINNGRKQFGYRCYIITTKLTVCTNSTKTEINVTHPSNQTISESTSSNLERKQCRKKCAAIFLGETKMQIKLTTKRYKQYFISEGGLTWAQVRYSYSSHINIFFNMFSKLIVHCGDILSCLYFPCLILVWRTINGVIKLGTYRQYICVYKIFPAYIVNDVG